MSILMISIQGLLGIFLQSFWGKKVLEEEIEQVFYTSTPLTFFTTFEGGVWQTKKFVRQLLQQLLTLRSAHFYT